MSARACIIEGVSADDLAIVEATDIERAHKRNIFAPLIS